MNNRIRDDYYNFRVLEAARRAPAETLIQHEMDLLQNEIKTVTEKIGRGAAIAGRTKGKPYRPEYLNELGRQLKVHVHRHHHYQEVWAYAEHHKNQKEGSSGE